MDPRKKPVYREWSPWPAWMLIMFWSSMLLSLFFVAVAPGESDQERVVGTVVLIVTVPLVQVLLVGLSVRLYRDEIVMGLGSLGIIRKRVRYGDIVRTESVKYSPLGEFGGWGVRRGKDGKRAWTARGDRAVVLHLKDGTRLYVGSDTPHRLEERIRTVAGTRITG